MRLGVLKLATGIVLVLAGSACCIPTEATIPPLPYPGRPTLTKWEPGALACLTEDAAIAVNVRLTQMEGYCGKLEDIILTTYPEKERKELKPQ